MLAAVLRVPATPIPPLFPAPARPILHLSRRLPAAPPMADAKKTDAAPPAPEPPEKPLPGDCCGSGCVRCVWDTYYDEMEDYKKALAAHEAATEQSSGEKASPGDEEKAKS